MNRPIKFGLIGFGRIGKRHVEHIQKYGELLALCDIDSSKFNDSEKSLSGVKLYADIDDFLKNNFDVISICTPNGLHAEQTIKCLQAGFHVICEKPMAIDVHDCGRMISEAERANRRLFIVKQNRFNPPVVALKKAIDEGRLGKVLSVQLSCFWNRNNAYYSNSWKGSKELDGGTLYTQFSHFIDLLYWMFGDVKTLNAITGNLNHQGIIDFEDSGVVSLKFYSDAIATINYTVNSYNRNMEGSLTVFGEKGTVKIGGQYLNELEYQSIENYEITGLASGNPPNQYGEYQGSMSNHDKVYENVLSVLNNDGVIATNGFEGLKTVEIIDRIYRSVLS